MANLPPPRSWRLNQDSTSYLISTSQDLLSKSFIQSAFAHKDMYWAKPLPAADLELVLSTSLNLGLYIVHPLSSTSNDIPAPRTISEPSSPRDESPTVSLSGAEADAATADRDEERAAEYDLSEGRLEQIGFARFITDHITIYFLTDVFVLPEHRGTGLAKWLISCCQDVMRPQKFLRRAMLMASPGVGEKFYARELGMYNVGQEDGLVCMSRKKYVDEEGAVVE